jgi:hypothetical protein
MFEDDFDTPPPVESPEPPALPLLRTFVVRRESRGVDAWETPIEEITVLAHAVEFNAAGNLLRLVQFYIDPAVGPTSFVVRAFNGWLDYREVIMEPSRLYTPDQIN